MLKYVIASMIGAAVCGTTAFIMALIGFKNRNDKLTMPAAILGGLGVALAVLGLCLGFFAR